MTSLLNSTAPTEAALDSKPEPKARSSAGWKIVLPILLILGFAAHIAWRLYLLRYVPTVVAHADEDRYLLTARALAGGPGGFGNDTEAFRRLGFPMLLAPIYSYTQDPFKVYHLAQMFGAIFNALTFPLAYFFARRVLNTSRWLSLGMAFVAAVLPAVVYYSEFVLTDVMFAPLGLAWLLLIHGWVAGRTSAGRMAAAIGAGLVIGFAYVTHIRGMVMLVVHLGVIAVVLVAKHGKRSWAIASGLAAILLTGVDWIAKQSLGNSMAHGGKEPNNQMLEALTDAQGFVRTLTDATGQFWYLSVATGGLGAVALVVAYRTVRGQGDFVRRLMFGTVFGSTVLISLASASALQLDQRVSNHAYFRYIAFLAPVWAMIGIAALVEADFRGKVKLIGAGAGVMGATLFVVLARMNPSEWFHPFDTPEVSFLTNAYETFRPFKASVLALGLLVIWLVRRWWLPAIAVTAVWATAMVVVNVKAIEPMVALEYLPGSRLVQDVGLTPDDIVQTASQVDMGSMLNHQREVYWAPITTFDAEVGQPGARATVVIAPWYPIKSKEQEKMVHWDGTMLGWKRIYTYQNEERQWAVWRRVSYVPMTAMDRQLANAR